MFKIASHNSLTYLPVKQWYLRPFKYMAQCQSKDLKTQYEKYDIRFFDIRIKFDSKQDAHFAHGLINYKAKIEDVFAYLNSKEGITVRILLENKSKKYYKRFREFCDYLIKRFQYIHFIGGRNKHNWEMVYKFPGVEPTYLDKYASNNKLAKICSGWLLDDLCPWIYAKCFNKKNIKKGTDKEYLMIDFVNIS